MEVAEEREVEGLAKPPPLPPPLLLQLMLKVDAVALLPVEDGPNLNIEANTLEAFKVLTSRLCVMFLVYNFHLKAE